MHLNTEPVHKCSGITSAALFAIIMGEKNNSLATPKIIGIPICMVIQITLYFNLTVSIYIIIILFDALVRH